MLFYAIFPLRDGTKRIEVMSMDEIAATRKQSKAADSPAWRNFFVEMGKKCVLKRGLKRFPLKPDHRDWMTRLDEQDYVTTIDADYEVSGVEGAKEALKPPAPAPNI